MVTILLLCLLETAHSEITATATSDQDAQMDEACALRCIAQHAPEVPSTPQPSVRGQCRKYPQISGCMYRCMAMDSDVYISCHFAEEDAPAEGDSSSQLNSMSNICSALCVKKFNYSIQGNNYQLAGLCTQHTDALACLRNCGAHTTLIAECSLPERCVNVRHILRSTISTIQDICNSLADVRVCYFPMMKYVPNAVEGIKPMLISLRTDPAVVSTATDACKSALDAAIAELNGQ